MSDNRKRQDRQAARIAREHFIMYQWIFFPETREWHFDDWRARMVKEGLYAPTTSWCDMTGWRRLWFDLRDEHWRMQGRR